jgi:HlyD family secretion protein
MELQKKSMKIGAVFLALIIVAGVLLMYTGNDAVAMGMKKKDGILTAEQVKVSFDSVNGRLVKEAVKEADEVKKGDVLMVLDSTDVDLSLEKTVAQIGQLEAQIQSAQGTMGIGFAQTDTTEEESRRGIDQQRAAADAAEATLANSRLITQAPGFADLKMSREKGQADLSAFQIRIYTDPGQGAIPGMTIEVKDNEFNQR